MSSNWELNGSYISFYALKYNLYGFLWSHISCAMLNELKKTCLACEGIFIGECLGARMFMIENLILMVPGRKPEDFLVVSTDVILTEKDVHSFGLLSAKFAMDLHHLKEDLKEELGPSICPNASSCIYAMIKANDQTVLNRHHKSVKSCVYNDTEKLTVLEDFSENVSLC